MKDRTSKGILRCAIYTRVSTDSGLEQDFNSLDNQREASEAYIKSADAYVFDFRSVSAILVARRHRTKVKDIEKIASTLTPVRDCRYGPRTALIIGRTI